jgi:hypothetical protein
MPTSDREGAKLRAAPRIKIFQPAGMAHGSGAPTRVHLLNISISGAQVHAPRAPAAGDEVWLDCGIPLGAARVQWTSGNRFGVKFADPIDAAQLEAILGASAPAPQSSAGA